MKQSLFLLSLFLAPVAARAQAQNNPQSNPFATCLVRGDNGDYWAGGEDVGLLHRDAIGNWTPFAGQAELGDASVTCIAVDGTHRVWVGTASAGVAVFDGATWKRFGVWNGPLAGRVNDLEIAKDGNVWGATDAGVFEWSEAKGWEFPGVFDGDVSTRTLAQRPVYALAFDAQNRVLEATDDGLNRLSVEGGTAKIEAIGRAESRFQLPRPGGDGFTPGPIHDVAVDSNGKIWCATRWGINVGSPDGAT